MTNIMRRELTNTEVLQVGFGNLSSINRQRRFILTILSEQKGCPNCGTKSTYFEAAGIALDDLDLLHGTPDPRCECPKCRRELQRIVPLMGENWRWRLIPENLEAKVEELEARIESDEAERGRLLDELTGTDQQQSP